MFIIFADDASPAKEGYSLLDQVRLQSSSSLVGGWWMVMSKKGFIDTTIYPTGAQPFVSLGSNISSVRLLGPGYKKCMGGGDMVVFLFIGIMVGR